MKTARWLFSFLRRPGGKPRSRESACHWCRQHLGAFYRWDDSLSDAELSEIERHVNACSECGKIWDEFRANQGRVVEAALPSFDKERVLGSILREIGPCAEPETRERQGYFPPNGWSLRLACVCLALVAIPVLAKIGLEFAKTNEVSPKAAIQSALDSPAPADSTANTERDKVVVPQLESDCARTTIDSDPSELELLNLPEEDVERTLLLATLPHGDEQLEEWARKEFPHVMWLYDELRELDDTLSWQDLLVRSGEIYRFDWPIAPDEPNVLPRLSALVRFAEAAGWKAEIVWEGHERQSLALHKFEIPVLTWADRDISQPVGEKPYLRVSRAAGGSTDNEPVPGEEALNRLVAMQASSEQVAAKGIDPDSYTACPGIAALPKHSRYSFVIISCGIIAQNVEEPELVLEYSQLGESPIVSDSICQAGPVFWERLVDIWTEDTVEMTE